MSIAPKTTALPDRIETGRLVLRAPEIADAPDLAQLANNPKIYEMLSRLPHPYGEADAEAFIETQARSPQEHAWAIIVREQGFAGVVSLRFSTDNALELGYWLGEPFWGRGFASEAAGAVVAAVQTGTIQAKARAENTASRRVLERLGFALVGQAVASCGPHTGVPIATYRLTIDERGHACTA